MLILFQLEVDEKRDEKQLTGFLRREVGSMSFCKGKKQGSSQPLTPLRL